jgi:sporulation protein YlmC with PRC-barrel domain
MKPYLIRTSAGATLMAVALCLTPQAHAADPIKRDAENVAAAAARAGNSARDIIGQDVRTAAGDKLGEVKDLIVSPQGRILYAVISSGGVLGVGDKMKAVPFSALRSTEVHRGALTVDLDKAKWEGAPRIHQDELDLLSTEAQSRTVYEYYGQKWDRDLIPTTAAVTGRNNALLRVSSLLGKNLKNAGQDVGEIEDVIVDVPSRRATALLDPDNDFAGTNEKYLIGFDQIMRNPDKKDAFSTMLTRAEFAGAKPARNDWSRTEKGYPYVWSGYSYTHGVGYMPVNTVAGQDPAIVRTDKDLTRRDSDRHNDIRLSVADVRQMLDKDPVLADAARHVILREENNKLVIRGTAASKDLRGKIADRVEDLAKGWNVDNEIEVRSAAE